MDRCLCWISLLWVIFVEGSHGACSYPGELAEAGVIAQTLKTSYEADDIVLYKCADPGTGHVFRRCLENGSWTDPSRSCQTLEIWDGGALAGVLVALFNYVSATIIIVYVKKRFPDGEQTKDNKLEQDKINEDKKQVPVASKSGQ